MSGPDFSIQLPDGRRVLCDTPPPFVMDTFKRLRAAAAAGRELDSEDVEVVRRWMVGQEDKYPTTPPPRKDRP